MIKNRFNNKGVSLVSLTVTVIILVIITNLLIYNVKDNLKVSNLRNMQNDISNLREKISSYYAQNGKIPARIKYTNVEHIDVISDAVDTGDFYVIDLEALENLTLNYGEDYKNITASLSEEEINQLLDLYIINETSHNIFYVEGIKVDNDVLYTDYTVEDVDQVSVDLRYVENVKIPEGFSYIEGTKDTGIKIRSNEDASEEYIWIVKNEKIETVPENIQVEDEEAFLKSVNAYKGYYRNTVDNTVIYFELEEKWTPTYDKSGIYKDKNNNIVKVPKGFQVCVTPGKNTVDEGIVIRNAETDDRYVWIEVPKSIYMAASSETDYENIESDMQNYTAIYKEGYENYADIWYAFDGDTLLTEDTENLTDEQKMLNNGCGLDYNDYIELRNNMYSSIYNNGGFWIGQYEAGTSVAMDYPNDELITPVSIEGAYPCNYITCAKAQEVAGNIDSGDYTSSLMFGIQWDLVLKFIENKSDKTKYEINKNSLSWGNYYESTFTIDRGEYTIQTADKDSWKEYTQNMSNYVLNENKLSDTNILLTAGASEYNKILNIYDFAGNVAEWTLEYSGDSSDVSCVRGGNKSTQTNNIFSSSRIKESENVQNDNIGFRVALY